MRTYPITARSMAWCRANTNVGDVGPEPAPLVERPIPHMYGLTCRAYRTDA